VCDGEAALETWCDGERMAGPGEQGFALGDDVVCCAVEVEEREGRVWRRGCDEGGQGCCRVYSLVQERYA
jgi:hypothetical protein